MRLYKCEECELLTSEEFFECPKCHSEREKIKTDSYDEEDIVYTLTMEDVYVALECIGGELEEIIIHNHTHQEIREIIRRKLDIPYVEELEATIKFYLKER